MRVNLNEEELREAFRNEDTLNRLMLELVLTARPYKCKLIKPDPASAPEWPKIWDDVLHDLHYYKPT